MKNIYLLYIMGFIVSIGNVFASKLPYNNVRHCVNRKIIAQNIKTKEIRQFNNTCELGYEWIELGRKNIQTYQKKESVIGYVDIPLSDNNNRYVILLSKGNQFDFNNSTYRLDSIKVRFIKGYKILIIKTNKSGKIYITGKTLSKVYLVIKEKNSLFIKLLNGLGTSKFIRNGGKLYKFVRLN